MKLKLIFVLFLSMVGQLTFSQGLTENQLKTLAKKVNDELKGVDAGNGMILKNCLSYGRTIVYNYEVPEGWYSREGDKQTIINNFKKGEFAEFYFKNDVDVDFFYWYEGNLKKKISIESHELGTKGNLDKYFSSSSQLGEYHSISGHSKAKGVNMKIKAPLRWEIKEGDRPNIVVKFVNGPSNFIIQVNEAPTFFSRNESKEILADPDYRKDLLKEYSSIFENVEIIRHSVVSVDNYPALEFEMKGTMERVGTRLNFRMKIWHIIYEDRFVYLQGGVFSDRNYQSMMDFFTTMANSVVFPDQY